MHNHIVVLLFVWSLIISFSFFEFSEMHAPLEKYTYIIIFIFIFSYYISSLFGKLTVLKNNKSNLEIDYFLNLNNYRIVYVIFVVLSILNIIIAGYIPFISMITIGDSRYAEFGISGIYGFYLAYSTALGTLSLFLYFKLNRKKFLFHFVIILVTMILFFTRQNIFVLLIEGFIIYTFLHKKIKIHTIFLGGILILMLFSYLGSLRSGDIKLILKIKEEYTHLPDFVFWLYGYNYFSGLNLSNLLTNTSAPYYDGSSIASLLPNFIKSLLGISFVQDSFLQDGNMNVSTALSSIYADAGIYEVMVTSSIFGFFGGRYFARAKADQTFVNVGIYSVLFFCALFSFFTNYWFYLPIIFQIVFIYIFSHLIFKRRHIIHA